MKIVFASNNPGKLKEINNLLKNVTVEIIPQSDFAVPEVAETGLTFVENALIKARHAAYFTGLATIADDSGIVVPALNGVPGIFSARYAGKEADASANNQKLLAELSEFEEEKRYAYFYCTMVFMLNANDPTPIICEGKWQGLIATKIAGTQGFGYDPLFYVPSLNKTAAELDLSIKNKISHRGIALQSLLKRLPEKI